MRTAVAVGRERVVGWLLLGLLGVIATGVWFSQFHYDVSIFRLGEQAGRDPAGILPGSATGLTAIGTPERFDEVTLSDKINGKAELYLPAGFRSLEVRDYRIEASPEHWIEVFLYEMELPEGAFAVFSAQRRPGAPVLEAGTHAYLASNAAFAVSENLYLEVIGSDASPAVVEAAAGFARQIMPADAVDAERPAFPPGEILEGSEALIATDAFGYEGFRNVSTARHADGESVLYAMAMDSPEAAREAAMGFVQFMLDTGGVEIPAPEGIPQAHAVGWMGRTGVVFAGGNEVLGVHDAPDAKAGARAAAALHQWRNP
jgi:hypothetical protein